MRAKPGYRETAACNREVLGDKARRILGRFETDTGVRPSDDN